MLYDRIKWHYDANLDHHDPEAASALLSRLPQTVAAAPSLWVPDGGYRIDATDHAEFQRPDPQWKPPPGLRGMVIRVSDGVYREPSFATDFRIMDEMLQRGELDYCMWYHLPSPNVSRQRAMDAIAAQIRESGVKWGRPGHGLSIDDEPTPYHDQVAGQAMVDLRNALQDTYQREELHYVGLYNGNYGFISEHGWQLWGPWPLSNGNMPSWTTNLVMQQWGVADAGGAPGFPNRPVDVNHLFDPTTLDRLTGRAQGADDLAQVPQDQWDGVVQLVQAIGWHLNAFAPTAGREGETISSLVRRMAVESEAQSWHLNAFPITAGREKETISSMVRALGPQVDTVLKAVENIHTASAVDVDALAKALAPLLNSGTDAHAVALEVADVLGDRLSTGGTEGGAS